ncbi:hypothetical protein BCR34DRAFT_127357 [Clohesyomyces aquaticus]|uniref:Secreted protein n=1 Tax=Clohesyomyces aquaticus TaxID=1231657 RepID=A0A1Y2AA39_9PLEO|nr:hypothetical protein BCR34DRAFT_127357 [Clohesyomyces aquaticus]
MIAARSQWLFLFRTTDLLCSASLLLHLNSPQKARRGQKAASIRASKPLGLIRVQLWHTPAPSYPSHRVPEWLSKHSSPSRHGGLCAKPPDHTTHLVHTVPAQVESINHLYL